MLKRVILTFVLLGAWQDAAGQDAGTIPSVPGMPPGARTSTPLVTVRLHAGPNVNLMSDWREGLSTLQDRTRQRGLSPDGGSCLCLSWGGTALAHVTPRLAIGAEFDMLRDSRQFTVTDHVALLQQSGTFAFGNETVARATQAVAAFYPREGSRMHLQIGAGVATGHTTLSTDPARQDASRAGCSRPRWGPKPGSGMWTQAGDSSECAPPTTRFEIRASTRHGTYLPARSRSASSSTRAGSTSPAVGSVSASPFTSVAVEATARKRGEGRERGGSAKDTLPHPSAPFRPLCDFQAP